LNAKVSVIIANYNKGLFIAETINSVLSQTFSNWELIIVDDCSSDNSIVQIENFLIDERISLYKNQNNSGANYSRNFGLEKTLGDYIIFLDADDVLARHCISERLGSALKNPDAHMIVSAMGVFYKTIGDSNKKWQPYLKNALNGFLNHQLPWSILQPLWKKSFLIHLKGFDESFERLQDVELNTRALLQPGVKIVIASLQPDCYYRIDEKRMNYDYVIFLHRWINAAIKYYQKFHAPAKLLNRQKQLMGTIFETFISLNYKRKKNNITHLQFLELKNILIDKNKLAGLNFFKIKILSATQFYNLNFIRIPGINKILKKMLIYC
jgi:glycosyltransferase involved in cell wall biosynthesis